MEDRNSLLETSFPFLIEWYRRNRRILPWRVSPTPYQVWISEIMLQQTRIEAVIPYYERFLKELPDLDSLANCDEDRLLKLWQGLGYYNRAKNLKKAAEMILESGGVFPEETVLLKKLPGIGEYTAGAIASIAFGKPEPAVDGNVLRVCTRILGCRENIALPATKNSMSTILKRIYPSGEDAGFLTQGLMELGEVICLPNGKPLCEGCPVKAYCQSKDGLWEDIPFQNTKKDRRIEEKTVFLLCYDGKYALSRRSEKGLLAGLWEFPNVDQFLTKKEAGERFPGLTDISFCGNAKHIFSHIEWHMKGFLIQLDQPIEDFIWASPAEIADTYAVPNAFQSYLQFVIQQ